MGPGPDIVPVAEAILAKVRLCGAGKLPNFDSDPALQRYLTLLFWPNVPKMS